MPERKERISDFYGATVDYEWDRLVQDTYHKLEYRTTLSYLKKHLPGNGLILDAGGGPGRYTIDLAKMGYGVDLLDLTEENINFARQKIREKRVEGKVRKTMVANITDLSGIRDNNYDAVICLGGPVSHIEGEENRNKAVSELRRVAKEGAPIFIGVFGRIGALMLSVQFWPNEIGLPSFRDFYEKGDDNLWHGKYYAHFFLPEELENMVKRNGLDLIETVGLEGIGANAKYVNIFSRKDRAGWQNFLEAHDKLAAHPASVGMSVHILAIGRKRRTGA